MSSVPKGIVWDDQPLGQMSDVDLGRLVGCNPGTVGKARKRRGVPAYVAPTLLERSGRAPTSAPPASPTLPSRVDLEGVILPPATPLVRDTFPAEPMRGPQPQPEWMERILFIPDQHRPYHDRKAWAVLMTAARWFQPHTVVILGDFVDCYDISRFSKDPTRRLKIDDEIADARDGLDEIDRLGATRKVYILGNHEKRYASYIAKNAPELWGQIPTLEQQLGLAERGWETVAYQDGISIGELYCTHDMGRWGKYALQHSAVESERCLVMGHIHKNQMVTVGDPHSERQRQSWCFGWGGDVDQVDYKHRAKAQRDFHLGFGLGYLDPEGRAYLRAVPIPRAMVGGRVVRL